MSKEKVLIKTYGCQMNDRDSEAVEMDLVKSGFEITAEESEADVIILNTCSVRDQAERKALGKVGNLKKLRRKKPNLQVGVIGCMAQSRADDIVDKNAHVNFVAGTDQLHKIPELIQKSKSSEEALIETGLSRDIMERLDNHPEGQMNASVAIMRGCNEYCTYCIVPFTRGQEKSRTIASIIAEVKALADKGVREIMYLGQNITAYGLIEARRDRTFNKEVSPFAALLRETAKIDGIKRIRFTSPHARYFNDDLIDTIAAEPKICRAIHFPLQSGSDRLLKVMRRRHTAAEFLSWINKMKERVEGITFTTDLIVGFPGETDEDFKATRDICNEIDFDQQFIFRYSTRKNTPAAQMPNQLDEETKIERNQILLKDLEERLTKKNEARVGTIEEIMVEGVSKRNDEKWTGRTTNYKIVIFDPQDDVKVGDLVNIKIDRATQHALYGSYLEHTSRA
ncbi:tRNA (N6-isopentenyl adenosine(37)-C2)-methylthiotransferase MiaB [Lentisphaera marina]|uniref:tRNA (N6-isopentenyl adenosine(37)-C2)-methylthiotransferase MiaB n=1 Tax=Lentisphaera marina TaxID=1111041 RepID=UPI00236712FE|nr:tRNA (N6-isopentenyl adenosine(37)-C2)-methylthiotransferase MiaB [Lentisphaera marina]MDD7984537.1 tRNA (N6-isopentenyl adenosine(37)-C2)-methylthiotransferase MiaB [Lentisphaera marina]